LDRHRRWNIQWMGGPMIDCRSAAGRAKSTTAISLHL
jgi:hypothetical protein